MLLYLIVVLISITLFIATTLIDRKFLGLSSNRTSPIVILKGLGSPIGEAIKLILKENLNSGFIIITFLSVVLLFLEISFLPISSWTEDSLSSYLITTNWISSVLIISTFGSKNKGFSLIGRLRMYRLLLVCELINLISPTSLSISEGGLSSSSNEDLILSFNSSPILGGILGYILSIWIHIERQPIDLPEAESDLAGGPSSDTPGIYFALIAIEEYRWGVTSLYLYNINLNLETILFTNILLETRSIINRLNYELIVKSIILIITSIIIFQLIWE